MMSKVGQTTGFTLIELLVVVAVIAILAAIAVPNFLEAQTRAKISRVKSDQRVIATALESYFVDHNTYPANGTGAPNLGLIMLTTPVSFIGDGAIQDPFIRYPASWPRMNWYQLGTGKTGQPTNRSRADSWGLGSYGPDGDDDTQNLIDFPFTARACPYDPTNGTISSGDIYRLRPDNVPNFLSDANPQTFP